VCCRIEATYCGCFPLCPNKLVYPEIFQDAKYLYENENQLYKRLKNIIEDPISFRKMHKRGESKDLSFCDWNALRSQFSSHLCTITASGAIQ